MYDVLPMQVLHSQANVNEYLPDKVLDKMRFLFLDVTAQIMVVTILHHNVNEGVLNERIKVANDEVAVESSHQIDLHQRINRFCFHRCRRVYYLYHVALVCEKSTLLCALRGLHVNAF